MKEKINYGFKEPVILATDHFSGSGIVSQVILRDDGQWDNFLGKDEFQNHGFETFDCTAYGLENQVTAYMKEAFGLDTDYSERAIGIDAGTGKDGNDPNVVYQSVRKNGLLPQELLPFSNDIQNIDQFYSPKPLTPDLVEKEKEWLSQYDFFHEWCFTPTAPLDEKVHNMKVNLKFSPLAISVYAWAQGSDGRYMQLSQPNHWVCVYGYTENAWKVFDSYDSTHKLYAMENDILYCKRIHIDQKTPEQKKTWRITDIFKSLLQALQDLLVTDIILINTPKPMENTPISPIEAPKTALGTLVKSYVGKDASPNGKAPQSLACAEGVSNILHEYDSRFPAGILSTQDLFKVLLSNKELCTPILDPLPGCVIISPTIGTQIGHTGFLVENQRIISNDSSSGLMQNNYSFNNWVDYFKGKKKLRVFIFQIK